MPTSTLTRRSWLLLFIALAAFYLYGLGAFPLVGPDEPRYAEVAREMLARRDLITPTLGGLPWFEKPPLLYWLIMASYRLFGVNEYAARLGPALCGLITAALVWWTAHESETRPSATVPDDHLPPSKLSGFAPWSALAFLSSLSTIGFSRGANFDIVLTMTVTGALSCFLVWHIRTATGNSNLKRASVPLLGFYCFIGLSLLAKGLVGVIILSGIITAYFAVRRELPNRTFLRSLLWGIPLALLVAVLWYGPMIYRHGWPFLDQFFVQHHLARFISNKYHHPQPVYFYLPILVMFALPWTILLVATVISSQRWSWRGDTAFDRLRVFAIIWIAFPLIFFSFSTSKLPGYILPVVPAVALLVGNRIDCSLRANRGDTIIRLTAGLLIAVAAIGAWFSVGSFGASKSWAVAALLVILIVAGAALLLPRHRVVWFLLFGLTPFAMTVIALSPAKSIASRESVSDLMQLAASRGYGNTAVVQLHTVERTAEFYAAGRLTYGSDGEPVKLEGAFQVADAARRAGGVILCLVPTQYESQLTSFPQAQGEIIGANGQVTLVVVRAR